MSAQTTMLDIHASALEQHQLAVHDFLLAYQGQASCVYGFVEGKDDPVVYRTLIGSTIPSGWQVELLVCGSKKNVLATHRESRWSAYPAGQICFFVDRDLDDLMDGPQATCHALYITDGYSIENSLCSTQLCLDVLEDVYGIRLCNPTDKEAVRRVLESNESTFCEALVPVMAQILLWRKSGTNANVGNLNLRAAVSFRDGQVSVKPRGEFLELLSKNVGCPLSDDTDILASEALIRAEPSWRRHLRGKYVLWFLLAQCKSVWQSIPQLTSSYTTRPSERINVSQSNALIVLGPRCRLPKSLKRFVEGNYGAYISAVAAD